MAIVVIPAFASATIDCRLVPGYSHDSFLADLRRSGAFAPAPWWGGLLLGAGAFQLYDGTIQHKLLRLHQIRYHVNVVPYDWTWNILAAVMLAAGLVLLLRAHRTGRG